MDPFPAGSDGESSAPVFPVFGPPGDDLQVDVDDMFADDLFAMDEPDHTESIDLPASTAPLADPLSLGLPQARRDRQAVTKPSPAASTAPAPARHQRSAPEQESHRPKRRRAAAESAARALGEAAIAEAAAAAEDEDGGAYNITGNGNSSAVEAARVSAAEAVDAASSGPSRPRRRAATEEERQQRSRERNRVHARKSRLRKKFFVDSLKASLDTLEAENHALRAFVRERFGKDFEEIRAEARAPVTASSSSSSSSSASSHRLTSTTAKKATQLLDLEDFHLMRSIEGGQPNFVLSDPSMPDNPIVYASQGFYDLTGYPPGEVIRNNCRFLQGPKTDPRAVARIREAIRNEEDVTVCLINYRKDGTPFWNRFTVAPLRDVAGNVVNYVGVQCRVTEDQARRLLEEQQSSLPFLAPPAASDPQPVIPAGRSMPPLLPTDLAQPLP